MKIFFALFAVLLFQSSAFADQADLSAKELLRCSNLHRISDPTFQQGDEAFAHLFFNLSSKTFALKWTSLGHDGSKLTTEESNYKQSISKPDFSSISITWGNIDEYYQASFVYLGGTTWGAALEIDPQHKGSHPLAGAQLELLCSETSAFDTFIKYSP